MIAARISLLVGGVLLGLGTSSSGTTKPNVIFILADDLGWGDLSCYGNEFLRTPNIDRLAKEGTLFTHFYVNGSVCSPSRCAFFTSNFPGRHRIHGHYSSREQNDARGMSHWLDPQVPNAARTFRQAGYKTAHIGKWHLGNDAGGPAVTDYGFDYVGSTEKGAGVTKEDAYYRANSSKLFVDEAIKFIDSAGDQPFYLQIWTLVPHATLNPTPEQLDPFNALNNSNIPHKNARAIFYASVTDLDQQIGRLLTALDRQGKANNTIVAFSSDNGPEEIFVRNAGHSGVGSPGPFRGRKRSLYEGGVRVPFLVRYPAAVPAGRVDDSSVVAGVDWLPTLCGMTGIPLPEGLQSDGEDRSLAWKGQPNTRVKPLFWDWRFNIAGPYLNRSPRLSMRENEWKLMMNTDRSRVELYNIPEDPMELNNRAEQEQELVERLAVKLLAWSRELPVGPVEPNAGKNTYPWPGATKPPAERQVNAKKAKKKAAE